MKKKFFTLLFTTLFLLSWNTVFANESTLKMKANVSSEFVQSGDTVEITFELQNYKDKSVQEIAGLQIDVDLADETFAYVVDSDSVLLKSISNDLINSSYDGTKKKYTFMYVNMNSGAKPLPRDNKGIASFKVKINEIKSDTKEIIIPYKVLAADTSTPAKSMNVDIEKLIIKIGNKNTETAVSNTGKNSEVTPEVSKESQSSDGNSSKNENKSKSISASEKNKSNNKNNDEGSGNTIPTYVYIVLIFILLAFVLFFVNKRRTVHK